MLVLIRLATMSAGSSFLPIGSTMDFSWFSLDRHGTIRNTRVIKLVKSSYKLRNMASYVTWKKF